MSETTQGILEKAKEIIGTPDKWTHGWGEYNSSTTCALGAVRLASGLRTKEPQETERGRWIVKGRSSQMVDALPLTNLAAQRLSEVISAAGNHAAVASYNDLHIHTCVMIAFDAAIELAEIEASQ